MTTLERERGSLQARLADLENERDKLQRELAEMAAERDRIAFALSVLDRIDSDTDTGRSLEGRASTRRSSRRVGATTEHLLKALDSIGRPTAVEAIIPAMREHGWAAEPSNPVETVRAALSRAVRDGHAVRLAVGTYGLPNWTTPVPAVSDVDVQQAAAETDAADTSDDNEPDEPDYELTQF